jgi:hypothetical protein
MAMKRIRLPGDPILELLDELDEMYGPLTDEQLEAGRRCLNEAK